MKPHHIYVPAHEAKRTANLVAAALRESIHFTTGRPHTPPQPFWPLFLTSAGFVVGLFGLLLFALAHKP
jgi:hypothetical protein